MSIAATSVAALDGILPKLTEKEGIVFEKLKLLGSGTNDDLAEALGWPINRVTGRVTGLRQKSMVACIGIGKSKAGNRAQVWAITSPDGYKLKRIANERDRDE